MADVSVQMGVSGVSQFKQGMAQAQASVKSIDAALKLNEKQFKATGDAEAYMQNKTTQLNQKLAAQQTAVKNAEQALKAMKDSGVDPLSTSYQKMETQLLNAQSALLDTQSEINELGTESADAAGKTDQLADSLGGLNKKISLDQVISAIGTITTGMEKAAQKAVELGKQIWENITDSARWADDTATQAMILNMDVETYQRYKGVFDTIGELTVQEWQKAKLKVQKAINDPTQDQTNILSMLGINTHEMQMGKYGWVEGAARDFEDVFWDIGETLRAKVASGEMTQDLADTYANALFGRGFAELNPMFALGKEGFAAALEEQTVASEEAIQKDAELNDKLIQLQNSFTALKAEVTSGLAPALTAAADTLNSLLQRVMEYLQTPEGQKALEDMGKAVEGLFSDLSKIDPEEVVEGFASVFNGIVEGLQWLEKNSGTVVSAMEAIVVGWGALKLAGGALEIYKLIQGIMGLTGAGAAGAASQAGTAAGAAWGSGFAAAVMKACPWLIGLYTLLNPADTAGNDLDVLFNEETGQLTTAGWDDYRMALEQISQYGKDSNGWFDTLMEVGDLFEGLTNIMTDTNAVNAIAKYRMYGNKETLIRELEALGYIQRLSDEELRQMSPAYVPPKEVAREEVDENGGVHMYDAEGNPIGYKFPENNGEPVKVVHKNRKTGEIIQEPEMSQWEGITADQVAAVQAFWDAFREKGSDFTDEDWDAYESAFTKSPELFDKIDSLMNELVSRIDEGTAWPEDLPDEFFEFAAEPVVPEDAAAQIAEQVGTVIIPARLDIEGEDGEHANGLWSVPFDGYRAILHKGERVVPAREVAASRNFSSNLYVESMYMNNGQDADGLAAAMAAAQRRTMSGYGS